MSSSFVTSIQLNHLDPYANNQRPVLLLHGLGADASSWEFQISPLGQAGFRPIAVDLPGFGGSKHEGSWSIKLAALLANQKMEALVPNQSYDVVGISMGGVVAQQLARDIPEKVKRLVLVNTFSCLRPRRLGEWAYLLRRFFIANVRGVEYQANLVAYRLFPEENQSRFREEMIRRIIESDRSVYRSAMWQLARFDSRKWLKDIRPQVLVISGELDTTVPLFNQVELAKGIRSAEYVVIPKARHGVIVDQAERFNQALLEFLEKTS